MPVADSRLTRSGRGVRFPSVSTIRRPPSLGRPFASCFRRSPHTDDVEKFGTLLATRFAVMEPIASFPLADVLDEGRWRNSFLSCSSQDFRLWRRPKQGLGHSSAVCSDSCAAWPTSSVSPRQDGYDAPGRSRSFACSWAAPRLCHDFRAPGDRRSPRRGAAASLGAPRATIGLWG